MTDTATADRVVDAQIEDVRETRAVATRATGRAVAHATPDPMELLKIALNKNASIEVITQLNQLRMSIEADNARKAFNLSLAAAKREIGPIVKNRRVKFESAKAEVKNGKVDYAHEDLAGIAEQIDPILSKYGLTYTYASDQPASGQLSLHCIISHELGHEKRTTLSAGVDLSGAKNHLQAIGSAATYLQRYTLKLALGLAAAEDDDANGTGNGVGASQNRADPPRQEQQKRPPRASQSQQPKGPHDISSLPGETWPQWGERYIKLVKTSNTVEEVKAWDRMNDYNLQSMFKGAPDVYKEVREAWKKHGHTLSTNTQIGGDKPQEQTKQPAPFFPDRPSHEADYEGFLKWAEATLKDEKSFSDGDTLQRFWNEIIEPANCFETDKSDLMSLYRKAEQRMGG